MNDLHEIVRKLRSSHGRSSTSARIALFPDRFVSIEVIGSHNCGCVLPQIQSNDTARLWLLFGLYEKEAKTLELSKIQRPENKINCITNNPKSV